jgi:NAD(P)-dependent dehydrogenase (short-subunit alcohol dehydrogenase family)
MAMSLQGVLITGASSGIGLAMAHPFAAEGVVRSRSKRRDRFSLGRRQCSQAQDVRYWG